MIILDPPFKITRDEYLEKAHSTRYEDDVLEIKLKESCETIWLYIQNNTNGSLNVRFQNYRDDDRYLENIVKVLKKAAICQAMYVETIGGDYRFADGFSETTNTFIANTELRSKEIARPALDILNSAGLLYRGL